MRVLFLSVAAILLLTVPSAAAMTDAIEDVPSWLEGDMSRASTILFFDDMESGENGWTHVDNTLTTPAYFHVDTYHAHTGSSWWCGTFAYDANGGYGNRWDQRLLLPPLTLNMSNAPTIAFDFRYHSEPGYDFTYLQTKQGGAWTTLPGAAWDGYGWWGSASFALVGDNPCEIRFQFLSDGFWSDEDGWYGTDGGAFSVDNIRVYDYYGGFEYFLDDAEPGGDTCTAQSSAGAGDYWHIIDRQCPAFSDPHSWWCGDDADTSQLPPNLNNSLISPPIDISTMTEGYIFYKQHLEMPSALYGYYNMQVSTDGGATWYYLAGYTSITGDFGACNGWSTWGTRGWDLSPYLPGTTLHYKVTVVTFGNGCPSGSAGGVGLMLDDFAVVSLDGNPQTWRVPGDFVTIQEAVDRAVAGDIIEVGDGIYTESVYIGKTDLTLVAGSSPVIDLGKSSPLDSPVGNCFTVGSQATGTVIDGFTLRHGDNGVFIYPDNVTVRNCEIYDNYGDGTSLTNHGIGIYTNGSNNSVLEDNHIHGNSEMGILVSGDGIHVEGNEIHDNGGTVDSYRSRGVYLVHSANCVVDDNTIYGHGAHGSGVAGGIVEFGDTNFDGVECGNNTFTNNVIYNNDYSIQIENHSDWPDAAHYNSMYSNAQGMMNIDWTLNIADATDNWWGDSSGPSGDGPGTGDPVAGLVYYDPWLTLPTNANIVCSPATEYLSIDDPTCTVDIDYLGGGDGLMYGYSLKLTWDNSVVHISTGPDSIVEGTLLSSTGSTFFNARRTGTQELTIDGMLLGDIPGVSGPGTMFSVEFTAASAVPYGTSPVNITIDRIRDRDNNVLTGFVDADGEIVVDSVAPVVVNVLITNNTLAHTDDYIKDGDAATVTADVSDAHPTFDINDIYADLTGLGGGAMVVPDTYSGGVATWNLASVTCTPSDGTVTVTVTAEDDMGNSANESDDIEADNTPPTAVTDFDAAPAHGECVLSWTNGTDDHLDGVFVERAYVAGAYPDYPWFVANWPDIGAMWLAPGDLILHEPGSSYVDAPPARNIYFYKAFNYDLARNYGPSAESARDLVTNYWLGDVAEDWGVWGYDGVVDDDDILKLSESYWTASPAGDAAECDVGPTVHPDWNRLGVPLPDDIVEFEDAMIFAMNYGVVSPRVVPYLPEQGAGSQLALALGATETRGDEVAVALRLEGNSGEVKGLSASLAYDTSELEFVSAVLSSDMASPLGEMFFMSRNDDGLIDLDAVVLGTGVTIGGSGDVAVLTFRQLSGSHTLEVESARVRDVENGELTAELADYSSGEDTPLVFRLVGNTPNPFNPITKIAYHVPHESEVAIRVYDVSGRLVATLVDGVSEPGRHVAVWNGRNDQGDAVGSGIYFCSMEAADFHQSRKMTLLK